MACGCRAWTACEKGVISPASRSFFKRFVFMTKRPSEPTDVSSLHSSSPPSWPRLPKALQASH